jgi:hypothetical protein
MKYTGYLVHRSGAIGEQVLQNCANTLLYEPNRKTRAQQTITNKFNATMPTIKLCIWPRRTAPQFPWSGRCGSNSFWLSSCSLKKNFDFATDTAQNIGFLGSTGFLICELNTKLIGIKKSFFWYLFTWSHVALYWHRHEGETNWLCP